MGDQWSRRTVLTVIAASGAASGCSVGQRDRTSTGQTDPEEIKTYTQTDSPKADSDAHVVDGGLPWGVTNDGVKEHAINGHMKQLLQAGNFTSEVTQSRENTLHREFTQMEQKDLFRREIDFSGVEAVLLRTPDGVFQRSKISRSDTTHYSFVPAAAAPQAVEQPYNILFIREILLGGKYVPVANEMVTDGPNRIHLEADEIASKEKLMRIVDEGATVVDFEGDGLVTDDGIFRSVEGVITFEDKETETVTTSFETRDVGDSRVDVPDWKDRVKDADPEIEVALLENNQFVELIATNKPGVPREFARIIIDSKAETYRETVILPKGLDAGQSAYIYQGNDGRLNVVYDEKPAVDPPPFRKDFEVVLEAANIRFIKQSLSP